MPRIVAIWLIIGIAAGCTSAPSGNQALPGPPGAAAPARTPAWRKLAYLSAVETSLNTLFKEVAVICIAAMTATLINEASNAYSMAVAPRSSLRK